MERTTRPNPFRDSAALRIAFRSIAPQSYLRPKAYGQRLACEERASLPLPCRPTPGSPLCQRDVLFLRYLDFGMRAGQVGGYGADRGEGLEDGEDQCQREARGECSGGDLDVDLWEPFELPPPGCAGHSA